MYERSAQVRGCSYKVLRGSAMPVLQKPQKIGAPEMMKMRTGGSSYDWKVLKRVRTHSNLIFM
jgi:hypothetical protein